MRYILLGLLLLWSTVCHADLDCDGVDDDVNSGQLLSVFMSTSTGMMMLWHLPGSTAPDTDGADCFFGGLLLGEYTVPQAGNAALLRNPTLSGSLDRLCAALWDGTTSFFVGAAYTPTDPTHLVWWHGGGQLALYKDGLLVTSISSGNVDMSSGGTMRFCGGGGAAVHTGIGRMSEALVSPTTTDASVLASLGLSRVRRLAPFAPSGYWPLDECGEGTSANGVTFADRSGNSRPMTGDDGANNTGLTCRASTWLSYPWGVE